MASVPGFSPYPLWSPQSQPGHHDGVSICLFNSVSRTLRLSSLPLVLSWWTPMNHCVRRPRALRLNNAPWTSLVSANSLLSPFTTGTLLQPFRLDARIPETCTVSSRSPYILEVCAAIVSRRKVYGIPSGKIQFDDDRLKDETEIKL